MAERPYTYVQKKFLKIDPKKLTEEEREVLRRVLLPRTRYLPDTDDECLAYAYELVQEPTYGKFLSFLHEIELRFGVKERTWSAGDRFARLYCRLKKNGRTFCAFALDADKFYLAVYFNAEERRRFEAVRNDFSREVIQWPYDFCPVRANGIQCVYYHLQDDRVKEHIFSLLAFKAGKGKYSGITATVGCEGCPSGKIV